MPIQRFESAVLKVEQLTPTVKNIHLSVPDTFEFKAGQFVSLILDINRKEIQRSYSIASSPGLDHIELCIKKINGGPGSTFLHKVKEWDKIKILGPAGNFTLENKRDKEFVFISVGTGIAPFRSMTHELLNLNSQSKINLLAGFRYENEILYEKEFRRLAEQNKNFIYHTTITRPQNNYIGNVGRVHELIKSTIKDTNKRFLLCGLYAMIQDVKKFLLSMGVPETQIHYERYD